jgi:hypothetical protein
MVATAWQVSFVRVPDFPSGIMEQQSKKVGPLFQHKTV